MPNLRICADNVFDRATLVTGTSATGYLAANMQKDVKSVVHRTLAPNLALQIEASFTTAETFNFVTLFGNYSPTATIQVRVFTNVADLTPVLNVSGNGGNAPAKELRGFTAAQAANAYGYGGGNSKRLYFAQTTGKWLIINISDASSTANHIETSRVIAGKYWSPVINAQYGMGLTFMDASEHKTSATSDLHTTIKTRKRKLKFSLANMRETDRANIVRMMRSNGKGYPFYLSLFPDDSNNELERDYEGWWKLSDVTEMMLEFMDLQNIQFEILEM